MAFSNGLIFFGWMRRKTTGTVLLTHCSVRLRNGVTMSFAIVWNDDRQEPSWWCLMPSSQPRRAMTPNTFVISFHVISQWCVGLKYSRGGIFCRRSKRFERDLAIHSYFAKKEGWRHLDRNVQMALHLNTAVQRTERKNTNPGLKPNCRVQWRSISLKHSMVTGCSLVCKWVKYYL